MSEAVGGDAVSREPLLAGQTVVVIGGSAGIGLETARRAREEGAKVIITARDPDRLHRAGLELGASIAAFDATDFDGLADYVQLSRLVVEAAAWRVDLGAADTLYELLA